MDKEREYFGIVEEIVSSYFDVSIEDMKMGNRKSNVTLARGYAMYILHRDLGLSISKIAKEFGRTTRAVFWHISKTLTNTFRELKLITIFITTKIFNFSINKNDNK